MAGAELLLSEGSSAVERLYLTVEEVGGSTPSPRTKSGSSSAVEHSVKLQRDRLFESTLPGHI